MKNSPKRGFTILELLVVVGLIALLATVVMVALSSARNKGKDANIKSNLANARNQAELFFSTNTMNPNSYTGVCTNGVVGGATAIGSYVLAAAQAKGLSSYVDNWTFPPRSISGDLVSAKCNATSDAWAAEVPLTTSGQMWCVDSTGTATQVNGYSIATGYVCSQQSQVQSDD